METVTVKMDIASNTIISRPLVSSSHQCSTDGSAPCSTCSTELRNFINTNFRIFSAYGIAEDYLDGKTIKDKNEKWIDGSKCKREFSRIWLIKCVHCETMSIYHPQKWNAWNRHTSKCSLTLQLRQKNVYVDTQNPSVTWNFLWYLYVTKQLHLYEIESKSSKSKSTRK